MRQLHQFTNPVSALLLVQFCQVAESFFNITVNRTGGIECPGGILKNSLNVLAFFSPRRCFPTANIFSVPCDNTAGRLFNANQEPCQGAFSAAAFSENGDVLSC